LKRLDHRHERRDEKNMMQNARDIDRLKNFYNGRRVLVTGGASFIGSFLTELLVEAGARVTVADDLSSGRIGNLDEVASDVTFARGDLRGASFAREVAAGQEVVFHLAALHGGRGYIESHPVECMNNMSLDHTVFASAVGGGAERVVYASSACAYPTNLQDSESARGLLEEGEANFEEPGRAFADGEYGWAKLMGELQLNAFVKQFGIAGVACRIFTAYGERENETHAVVALIAKALAGMDPYPVWGSGEQTRNFTYVADTVMGLALSGACIDQGFVPLNVGSPQHYRVLDLCQEIFRHLDWCPLEIHHELDRPVGVKSRAASQTRCRELLGWVPRVDLAAGVARTVDWYRTQWNDEVKQELETRLMER
jgi:nucleoside-diphosphate-sugar epimerase